MNDVGLACIRDLTELQLFGLLSALATVGRHRKDCQPRLRSTNNLGRCRAGAACRLRWIRLSLHDWQNRQNIAIESGSTFIAASKSLRSLYQYRFALECETVSKDQPKNLTGSRRQAAGSSRSGKRVYANR